MARRKQAHKLQFTIMQASRNTIPVWLTLLFITFPAWSKAPAQLWAGWVLLAGAAYMARNRYLLAGRDLARVEQAPQVWGRRLFTSTVLLGGLIAAGPGLLFPHLDDIGRMYVTMLLVCWLAAAMTSLGAWPRLYIAYVCLFNAGLALAWWRAGSAGSVYAPQILAMLALHAMLLVGFARSFAQQFDQSIDVRFANEALVEQVTLAREAAEKASDAKSRFLAVASHDLRQPLHAVTLLNGMLSRPQPQERVAEISHQMGRSLCAMESMFNSVLDFSKIEAARVVPRSAWHRLDPLFERLADDYGVLAAQKGLQLRMQAQALEIFTDAQLLERMLRNMLDNAVKFTARGAVALEARMDAEALVLTVSDSGPGIPANLREAVFGEYYQASGGQVHAGLGLGLAIVRRLAGLLQMSVEVRDALPQGARFELTIQAGQVRAAQQGGSVERSDAPVGAGASQSDLRGFFVVYVDDDAAARDALALLLDDWGCASVIAASLADALRLLEGRGAPHAVLSDYALDEGHSGVEVIEALRERYGPLSGAILTGESLAMRERLEREIEYPVLRKPVSAGDVRALLEVFKGIG